MINSVYLQKHLFNFITKNVSIAFPPILNIDLNISNSRIIDYNPQYLNDFLKLNMLDFQINNLTVVGVYE